MRFALCILIALLLAANFGLSSAASVELALIKTGKATADAAQQSDIEKAAGTADDSAAAPKLIPQKAAIPTAGKAAAAPLQRSGITKKYIAQASHDVDSAVSEGCRITRSVFSNYQRKVAAMECDSGVGDYLGLQEDFPVYALDLASNRLIGADRVHAGGNTGQGTKVAVLDTGIDYNHPDLRNSYLGGYDFVNDDNDPMDDHGHGTAIAGIITADSDLAAPDDGPISYRYGPARGVAPGAGIYSLKVISALGDGDLSDVIAAIYWSANGPDGVYGTQDDPGVAAISASLGYIPYESYCDHASPAATEAIMYAESKGIATVVASGNNGASGVRLPACISYAIGVGAVNKTTDALASFSSTGYGVDIVAPGTEICTTILGGGYACDGVGTSDAAPMVAGTVALIKKAHPGYSVAQVKQALRNMAVDKTGAPISQQELDAPAIYTRQFSTSYGWGRVDSYGSTASPSFNYHTECRSSACVLVSGAGSDQCQSTAECFCSDTDGGQNYKVAGQTSGMYGSSWNSKFDTCASGTQLIENYCSGRNALSQAITCPNGGACFAGACLEPVNGTRPDLIISSYSFPSQIPAYTPRNITITTRNIGAGTAAQSATGLYIGRIPQGEIAVPQLGPYQQYAGIVEISCFEVGEHDYSIMADSGTQVQESNESNNEETGMFQCVNATQPRQPLAKKSACPSSPVVVDCLASDSASPAALKPFIWYDSNGCAYSCRKVEVPAPSIGAATAKKPAASTITSGTAKKTPSESPAVPPAESGSAETAGTATTATTSTTKSGTAASGSSSAVDNIANAMVGEDVYARAMTVLGVYLEEFRK